jgi:hypothetical protein
MDPAGSALRTMGCATQIELEKVTRFEWTPRLRRGRERRDVRRSGRGTRARHDDEGRCEIHRHGRLHQTRFGDAREASRALDSQIAGVFLTALFSPELFRVAVDRVRGESGKVRL